MCGIAGAFGAGPLAADVRAMVAAQRHRGPDAEGLYVDDTGRAALGHDRLSVIDLSRAGRQPMASANGRFQIVFNGEIYNYVELRAELADYPYRTRTDTEVILAAYEKWGAACLDHFIGMFALLIWDTREQRLFAARDRFGVKPLYYHQRPDGTLLVASEIKALHAAGVDPEPDSVAWATYLTYGLHDHIERTFWSGVRSLPAGHTLTWADNAVKLACWYDVAARTGTDYDDRAVAVVKDEYLQLLHESVRLRFRADVPVGINLSGGLDSSTLLTAVRLVQGAESNVAAFTYVTGDPAYDELPWVRQMLARTHHPLIVCELSASDVPALAESVQTFEDEPFGGLPTLAYARLFERARAEGVVVLLDGQGMDEQWGGYDYYRSAAAGGTTLVQGMSQTPTRAECLTPDFRVLAEPFEAPQPFPDRLRNLQYRDARFTKIPRALRFNDRVSMRSSTELREPFLDHRLFELALRQPPDRKIGPDTGKVLLRDMVAELLPDDVVTAPKRPLQTPQREWLRGPLKTWTRDMVERALADVGGSWLDPRSLNRSLDTYWGGTEDSSFHVWQWIGLGLASQTRSAARPQQPVYRNR